MSGRVAAIPPCPVCGHERLVFHGWDGSYRAYCRHRGCGVSVYGTSEEERDRNWRALCAGWEASK